MYLNLQRGDQINSIRRQFDWFCSEKRKEMQTWRDTQTLKKERGRGLNPNVGGEACSPSSKPWFVNLRVKSPLLE